MNIKIKQKVLCLSFHFSNKPFNISSSSLVQSLSTSALAIILFKKSSLLTNPGFVVVMSHTSKKRSVIALLSCRKTYPPLKTNRLFSHMIDMQLRVKIKMEKLFGMILNLCQSMVVEANVFLLKYSRRVEMKVNCKRRYSKDLQKRGLEWNKYYIDLINMLKMPCQRNENRIRKWFVVYNTYTQVRTKCTLNQSTNIWSKNTPRKKLESLILPDCALLFVIRGRI